MHVQSLHRSLVLCLAAAGGLILAGCANPNAAATGGSSGSSGASSAGGGLGLAADQVVAQADGITITGADVDKGTAGDVYKLEEQLYQTRRGWAENEIAKRLLERKAHETDPKMGYEEYLAKEVDSKIPATSDATAQMYYKQNSAHFNKKPDGTVPSFDEIKDQIRRFLDQQNKNQAEQEYVQKLMDDSHVKFVLEAPEPPTMQVSADDDPSTGPKDAPVTIIEFADYECPACRQAALQMPQLLTKYKDKVRLVFRDYPLSKHPDAFPSAIAADCALEQGNDKFWTYHDLLYQKQIDGLGQANLKQYARDAGLDATKFDACFTAQMSDPNSKATQEIKHDMEDGDTAGVTATPTFYVNGKMVSGFSMDQLSQLVDNELKKKGAS